MPLLPARAPRGACADGGRADPAALDAAEAQLSQPLAQLLRRDSLGAAPPLSPSPLDQVGSFVGSELGKVKQLWQEATSSRGSPSARSTASERTPQRRPSAG